MKTCSQTIFKLIFAVYITAMNRGKNNIIYIYEYIVFISSVSEKNTKIHRKKVFYILKCLDNKHKYENVQGSWFDPRANCFLSVAIYLGHRV